MKVNVITPHKKIDFNKAQLVISEAGVVFITDGSGIVESKGEDTFSGTVLNSDNPFLPIGRQFSCLVCSYFRLFEGDVTLSN